MSKFTTRLMRFVPAMAAVIVIGGGVGRKW